MNLTLYDTMTRAKAAFVPADPSRVGMYVCGPTVYDRIHVGNARPLIVFDVLFRLLRVIYGDNSVRYVRNLTDVDDKINARAAERGIGIGELTRDTVAGFHEDAAALGVLPPTVEPRATEHVPEMVDVIGRLLARGHAYEAEGHVLFDVASMPDYGALSRRRLDDAETGHRVAERGFKRTPADFVLWKPSAPAEPGWDSPWGRGRPGWHVECSAMSWKHLGETFDIHGGGVDLAFPHHEAEIGQSRCAFGHDHVARTWVHNGMVTVDGRKMSKSDGNFVTVHDMLRTERFGGRRWHGEAIRLAMLRAHYRQPVDWTVKAMEDSDRTLDRWRGVVAGIGDVPVRAPSPATLAPLLEDLGTPALLADLHGLFASDPAEAVAVAWFLGLLRADAAEWRDRAGPKPAGDADLVASLVARRTAARAARDWPEADRLRAELAALGHAENDRKAMD